MQGLEPAPRQGCFVLCDQIFEIAFEDFGGMFMWDYIPNSVFVRFHINLRSLPFFSIDRHTNLCNSFSIIDPFYLISSPSLNNGDDHIILYCFSYFVAKPFTLWIRSD